MTTNENELKKQRKKPGRPRKGQEKLAEKKVTRLVKAGIKSASEIAKITDTSESAVRSALKRYGIEETVEELEEYKKNKIDIFEGLQGRIVKHIEDEDIQKCSFRDKIVGIGVIQDKIRDLRGGNAPGTVNITLIAERAAVLNSKPSMKPSPQDIVVEPITD